jgi:hypothetical protein
MPLTFLRSAISSRPVCEHQKLFKRLCPGQNSVNQNIVYYQSVSTIPSAACFLRDGGNGSATQCKQMRANQHLFLLLHLTHSRLSRYAALGAFFVTPIIDPAFS